MSVNSSWGSKFFESNRIAVNFEMIHFGVTEQ